MLKCLHDHFFTDLLQYTQHYRSNYQCMHLTLSDVVCLFTKKDLAVAINVLVISENLPQVCQFKVYC